MDGFAPLGQCVCDWSLARPLKFIPKVFHLIFLAGKQDYMKTSIHKATQMFIMVAKDTEEGHYSFPYDNIEGLLQPGFQKDPTQGGFYLNISRKWILGLLLLKDPRYSYRSCLPSSHEHSEWVGNLGSAEKLCTPCLEGHLSQGKTCIKELWVFFPPCHLLVWVARGLSLFSVMYVCHCEDRSVWLCCERAHETGTVQGGRQTIYVYSSSFMHVISQANIDTWTLSNQN